MGNKTATKNTFTIPRQLPSLNQYITVCRRNRYAAATFKKEIESEIRAAITAARVSGNIRPIKKRCKILFEWHEKTKRRDCDNIQSAQKYILDALQTAGILENDNRKWVSNTYHNIVDDTDDFVVVDIVEE